MGGQHEWLCGRLVTESLLGPEGTTRDSGPASCTGAAMQAQWPPRATECAGGPAGWRSHPMGLVDVDGHASGAQLSGWLAWLLSST